LGTSPPATDLSFFHEELKMKKLMMAGALALAAGTAGAQASDCPAATAGASAQNASRDVCLQAKDVFQLMAPQLGAAITGGNATLAQGGTLGGIGHFTVEARANIVAGAVPDVTKFPAPRTSAPTSEELPSKSFPVPLPAVDGAIGLFKGLPLGLTNVGGVDLLLSATYIPTVNTSGLKVTPDQNLKIGYGARIGLLQESLLVPGVSFTYLKRDLPTTTIDGTGGDFSFTMSDASIKTSAWRIVASKSLILFGLAAGVGQDKYDESATFSGSASSTIGAVTVSQPFTPFSVSSQMTRTNYFADVSMNLLLLKLVGEVGQVSGGTLSPLPFNTFSSTKADDSRLYGSVGLRFNW
jgi:hypothetical protein